MSHSNHGAQYNGLEIAVIGMAGRFPGAKDVEQFWRNLRDGVESISFFSDEELRAAGVADAALASPNYVKARGALADSELFDASFFGVPAREAEIMDPQHRHFLECSWEALENAGYDPETFKGAVGLFAGNGMNTYLRNVLSREDLVQSIGVMLTGMGAEKDHLTTRVAYKLGLRGPAVTVQTSCSTSLVAVALACQSLLSGACDLALSGGVSISGSQHEGYWYQDGGILSPDGHCRTFDADAQGTVSGAGVAIVVLKRLADALADRDTVLAVIKGSAVNNDGGVKVGYTAPGLEGQAQVIRAAQIAAEVDPETISYVEAHGTATALGDPVEVAALTQAFRSRTQRRSFCALGSVKSNVGHLDTAAGVAGLIKTVLALKHSELPPSLHYTSPNPRIEFADTPFFVNAELRPWESEAGPRRAGVSSFGIGGTNAHVIVEEAPEPAQTDDGGRALRLLTLSARSAAALDAATDNLAAHLAAHPEQGLADVAYTLQVGRKSFAHRRALVCGSREEALSALRECDPRKVLSGVADARRPRVAFLFPGQGAQHVGMGRELYQTEEVFRAELDRCADLLLEAAGWDLRAVLYPAPGREAEAEARLTRTEVTQPALFAVEYALARLWQSWGVEPEAMLGHSVGEYVAACVAGVLSVEEAVRVVAARGRLMGAQPAGAMLAVGLGEEEVRARLATEQGAGLWLAAVNGAEACVVAGEEQAVARWEADLTAEGLLAKRLKTSHAFHSGLMEGALAEFGAEVGRVELRAPRVAYVSNVTGRWVTAAEATDAAYWVKHLRETVRFDDGLRLLLEQPNTILLEVGPGKTLSGLARRHAAGGPSQITLSSLPEAARRGASGESAAASVLQALGRLWLAGVSVDWQGFNAQERRRRVPLPTYPFERQRYWIEAATTGAKKTEAAPATTGRLKDIADWFYAPVWKQSVAPRARGERTDVGKGDAAWVFLLDECGLGESVARRVEQGGGRVVRVRRGARFEALGEDLYAVNPAEPGDYLSLLRELAAGQYGVGKIVHLWSVTGERPAADETEFVARAQEAGFYSLLRLAQALGELRFADGSFADGEADALDIAVVSDHMQEVTGADLLHPEKATLLGPCGVIPKEYPHVTCRSIDVVLPPTVDARERLAALLLDEIATASGEEAVAYRNNIRWVRDFERVRLEEQEARPARLRERGVYLITGGTGGIGLTLAGYLAEEARARLALLGRKVFPAKEDWPEWLETHAADDELSVKIRKLQAIEEAGGEVLVLSADVSDERELRAALEAVRHRFGRVDGVIHAAGVQPHTLIQRTTPEMAAEVLAPKVEGTRLLARLLEADQPDFFVLCSSHRSFLPGAGTADYCGANAYLDAFARRRQAEGGAGLCVSINWDWWLEVGMARLRAAADEAGAVEAGAAGDDQTAQPGISSREGVVAFRRILRSALPQVAVAALDLPHLINRNRAVTATTYLKGLHEAKPSKTTYTRPETADPYVAPSSDVEQTLVEIWQDLLGVEPVGVQDNFFELGGDSVIGLQIIAKANQAGLGLTPGQVFEYQTIAELAAVAGVAPAVHAEQGVVSGAVALTPIQRWFFEQEITDPHHWNQFYLLEVTEKFDRALLTEAVRRLLEHHDALRARFRRTGDGWQQTYTETVGEVPFAFFDLSATPAAEQSAAIEREAAAQQASLNLSDGPLVRGALFDLGDDRPARLMLVAHHLVMDNLSWPVLIEDLFTAYRQLQRGQAVELPAKTTSFQHWSRRLSEYARTDQLKREADYWLGGEQPPVAPLPLDYEGGSNTVASSRRITVELGADETQQLLREVPKFSNTQVGDVLAAALVPAFAEWTGENGLLVAMEGHGREAIFQEVDLTRTVGWFTNLYPVRLRLEAGPEPGEVLRSVREQLRRVPNRGIGYGLLRYLCDDAGIAERLKAAAQPEVVFLYHGQFDQDSHGALPFRPAAEDGGPIHSPRGLRTHLFEVGARFAGGRLHVTWTYSENLHTRETVERLAASYLEALRALIEHAGAAGTYAAADFPEAGLSQQDLDDILAELSEFEG
nr:Beta-ketoacyl synthase [uncultured bacterium]